MKHQKLGSKFLPSFTVEEILIRLGMQETINPQYRSPHSHLETIFQTISDSRFNEYIPAKPLIGLGFFSCLE